jgi:Zn-dependent protease
MSENLPPFLFERRPGKLRHLRGIYAAWPCTGTPTSRVDVMSQQYLPQNIPVADEKHRISPIFGALVGVFLFGAWASWTDKLGKAPVFIFVIAGWVVSLCLHEYAHARTAYWAGDASVAKRGYLTLDPTRYVHPGLSLLLPIVILLIGGIGLPGGAVYIQMGAIRDPRKRSMVSLAGPFANLVFGIVCALPFLVARKTIENHMQFAGGLAFLATLQFIAMIINLLPIPGLDGFGAIEPFLGRGILDTIAPYRGYAPFILFFLVSRSRGVNHFVFGNADHLVSLFNIKEHLADQGRAFFQFWSRNDSGV